ncbi:DUF4302 domain-containing protein [Pontibacter pamirensis]|uniref:DUF4302 domain-containing protein n=1 Tax=Pontibacter pamirensis TaxID=2562824 RepID=UPI0013898DDB|nr:DUF4302 domain-containing protein [Pontibacter pamirensis]
MRKIWLLGLLIVSMLSACDKDDNEVAPGERPDERLNQVLSEYKSQLVNAEYGWKATLFPEGGAGYSFLFDFSENDRVITRSDINAGTAAPLESTYRLKAAQLPSLLFDTYTYLHILADPDATKSGGEWGEGRVSDYEFSFDSVSPDSIILTGNYNDSRLILVRATADEASNYISRVNENAQTFENINNFTSYFKQLEVGNQSIDIVVNTDLRTITFTYDEGSGVRTFTTSYYFTPEGLRLLQPLNVGGLVITSLNEMQYSAFRNRINLTVNGTEASIQETSSPAYVDPQVARTFYNNPPNGAYWRTVNGFTVEGVVDTFNVGSIANLELITLYIQASPPYDGLIFWTTDGKFFGPALRSRFTDDGRIVFTYGGEFGTTPEQAAPMVNATREQLTIPEGYYVIRTGPNTYDLVSAKDGKTWISFQ